MINDSIYSYLEKLISPKQEWVVQLEETARANRVPIMESVAIDFMLKIIQVHQPKKILEIGTAIGYSALRMLDASPKAKIITIEKDEARYKEAIETIENLNKNEQIHVLLGDALEILEQFQSKNETFDFIFIDAAKGKYKEFFQLVHPLLETGGLLVTDNVLFRNYVVDIEEAPKRFKSMVRKIDEYNHMLTSHPEYITSILPIGDGVMLSFKKEGRWLGNDG